MEPELGQMIFGTPNVGEHSAPNFMTTGLNQISELLGDNAYSVEFENEVFSTFPYYWGDCTCGYDLLEEEWDKEHFHSEECYQAKLSAIVGDEGIMTHQAEVEALCKEMGLDPIYGSAVHCTCTYQDSRSGLS